MKAYPSVESAVASMSPGEIALCTVPESPYQMREDIGLICCDTGGKFWATRLQKVDLPKDKK